MIKVITQRTADGPESDEMAATAPCCVPQCLRQNLAEAGSRMSPVSGATKSVRRACCTVCQSSSVTPATPSRLVISLPSARPQTTPTASSSRRRGYRRYQPGTAHLGHVHSLRSGDDHRYSKGAWTSPADPRLTPEQKANGDITNSRHHRRLQPYHWKTASSRQ